MMSSRCIACWCLLLILAASACAQSSTTFEWPDGKQMALSLTFDDARPSQVNGGTDVLDRYGVKATFYVVPNSVRPHLEGWKKAVARGHEIANHSSNHPCTGNFGWSRDTPLEDYTLEQMQAELIQTNEALKELLGVDATSFAYPCGETFVGRGTETESYVPVTAALFQSSRRWLDESTNDPLFVDFAQVRGNEMDGKSFDEIKARLEAAREEGRWVVLAGHEIGEDGHQTVNISMLEELLPYALDPANGIWLATVSEVATYIGRHRSSN